MYNPDTDELKCARTYPDGVKYLPTTVVSKEASIQLGFLLAQGCNEVILGGASGEEVRFYYVSIADIDPI